MDSFVPKQGYGHSTFEMALECKQQINAKQLVFFHFDPSYNDEKLNLIKEQYQTKHADVIMAYEGLEIRL